MNKWIYRSRIRKITYHLVRAKRRFAPPLVRNGWSALTMLGNFKVLIINVAGNLVSLFLVLKFTLLLLFVP